MENIPQIRRKTPTQKRFWTPPPTIRFPPPFLATLCHFPQEKEAPTRPTPIPEASKSGFGKHTLQYGSPPPPPNSRDTFCGFCPPPQPLPKLLIFLSKNLKPPPLPDPTFHTPNSGHVRPRQGTEICNFGAPSPVEALHWIFCFFSRSSV